MKEIEVGDVVTRMLAGDTPINIYVTEITDDLIICGPWKFDKYTLCEIDDNIECPISHLVIKK
jgi:hypothetical protein